MSSVIDYCSIMTEAWQLGSKETKTNVDELIIILIMTMAMITMTMVMMMMMMIKSQPNMFLIFFRFKPLGWGRTATGQGANYLQQAMLRVANDNTCWNVNGRIGPVDTDTMICAGGQGQGAPGGCQVNIDDSHGECCCFTYYHFINFKTDNAF